MLLSVLAVACVDPAGDYKAFRDRLHPSADAGGGGSDHDGAVCLPSTEAGDYIFALSATLAPQKPIVAKVTLTGTDDPPTVSFETIQALSAADRATPVGDPVSAGPFDVVDGVVTADIPGLQVGGAANPITTGSDIAADVSLVFDLCGNGAYLCGDVTGQVTQPLALDLIDSTFTLSPVDIADVTALPLDCAGNTSDPLP
jgi:hypothetical protein